MPNLIGLAVANWRWLAPVLAAAILCGLWRYEAHRADRYKLQRNLALAELNHISTAKNEQAKRTTQTIRYIEREREAANNQAERIERAPTPSNCETASEVMGADL